MLKLILMERFQKMCSPTNTRFSHADETERGEVSRQRVEWKMFGVRHVAFCFYTGESLAGSE
jgi:hypothetical protein